MQGHWGILCQAGQASLYRTIVESAWNPKGTGRCIPLLAVRTQSDVSVRIFRIRHTAVGLFRFFSSGHSGSVSFPELFPAG